MHNYIHIPKTGGTAIKFALEGVTPKIPISMPNAGHNQHLNKMKNNVCFVIRDPWERFCSGFWERVTVDQRKNISATRKEKNFGYLPLSSLEKNILNDCETPNDFVNYIRHGGTVQGVRPGIFELTGPITHWLGNLLQYQQQEHKVTLVFDIKSLNYVMETVYGLEMPTDPFKQRSRKLFDQEQSYEIAAENLDWFKNIYRKEEYDLLEYIKKQQYYMEKK